MTLAVFDLDGTLLDTDRALAGAFERLGVPAERVTFGHVLADECARLGLRVQDYLDAYDDDEARPFAGVDALLGRLDRWAVCSNKHPRSGRAELARLGWTPEVALFSDAFEGGPKRLGPVLELLGVAAGDVVFVGDTVHDRRCALDVGCRFGLAGWNLRARRLLGADVDLVLEQPLDLLEHL